MIIHCNDPRKMERYLRYAFEFEKYVHIWSEALSVVNTSIQDETDAIEGSHSIIHKLQGEILRYQNTRPQAFWKRREFEDEKRHVTLINSEQIAQYEAMIPLLQQRIAVFKENQTVIYSRLTEARKTLQSIYSLNYIHRDYQGMIPVGAMLNYLETGVCNTVEGAGGIFSLYRKEFREDQKHYQIMQQLIKTNQYLAEISYNTRMMVQELKQMNATLYQIKAICEDNRNTLSRIESNTDAIALYSKQSAMANSYTAWMMYQKF